MNNNFSTIISVYINDKPDWFEASINSIINQTIPPKQIVVVKDGPINSDIDKYINTIKNNKINIEFTIYESKINLGRGNTLNPAIDLSKYELISLMDSDDISRLDRFEKQLKFFKNNPHVDILGGQIEEFHNIPGDTGRIRKVSIKHDEIIKSSRTFCPMNNVSIMMKKKAILNIGGFIGARGVQEDYILWVKLMSEDYKFANIKDILVDVRVNDLQNRRRGFTYILEEIKMQKLFYNLKHISFIKMILNIVIRVISRLMPSLIRKIIYSILRKKSYKKIINKLF